MERLYKLSWRFTPFLWQEIDEGILPALYAAATPHAEGGAFYGPRGIYEAAGGGVNSPRFPSRARNDAASRRLWEISEQLTGVSFRGPTDMASEVRLPESSVVVRPEPMESATYTESSRLQAAGLKPAIALFQRAAQEVPLPTPPQPIVIADYGAATGHNSLRPMSAAIEVLRQRTPTITQSC